jgi:hypothetical protein
MLQELADRHILAIALRTGRPAGEQREQGGGRLPGHPAADEKDHGRGEQQQDQGVRELKEYRPQCKRAPEGVHEGRQPLIRGVSNDQGPEQPAEQRAEELVEDPAGDPVGDRGQRKDIAQLPLAEYDNAKSSTSLASMSDRRIRVFRQTSASWLPAR